jgi:hypothetical protein
MLRGAPDEDEAARPHIHPISARHTVPCAAQVLRDVGPHFDHHSAADFGRFEQTGVDRGGAHRRVIRVHVSAPHRFRCTAGRAEEDFPPSPLSAPRAGTGRPGDRKGRKFVRGLGRGRRAGFGRRLAVGYCPARFRPLRRLHRRRRRDERQTQNESREDNSGGDRLLEGRGGNHPSLR